MKKSILALILLSTINIYCADNKERPNNNISTAISTPENISENIVPNLTDNQKEKIAIIRQKYASQFQETGRDSKNWGSQMGTKKRELVSALNKEISSVFTEEQKEYLQKEYSTTDISKIKDKIDQQINDAEDSYKKYKKKIEKDDSLSNTEKKKLKNQKEDEYQEIKKKLRRKKENL